MAPVRPIPITVITGFLGSGKTTLILNLLPQLQGVKIALLKNEFGDVAVDSELASNSAISGVQELLNGCICCNLVGQLSDALETLRTDISPDRIIIETSGSAFPATLAMEINRLARETNNYILDGVMSVIDVENWQGYEDKSYTAKVQAQYTDLIILNKWEMVSERRLEDVEDRILDLELDIPTPRVKSDKGWVDKDVVFGLDAKMAKQELNGGHHHEHENGQSHQSEVEVLSIALNAPNGKSGGVDLGKLQKMLKEATRDEIYRIKGVLYATSIPKSSTGDDANLSVASLTGIPSRYILNWAFGRWTFTSAPFDSTRPTPAQSGRATPLPSESGTSTPMNAADEPTLRLTIITARYESNKWKRRFEAGEFVALADDSNGDLRVEKAA